MSSYLSCVVQCASNSVSEKFARLVNRTTRPIFEEDVDSTEVEFFNMIQSIEFPNKMLVDKNCVVLNWQGKERFDFTHFEAITKEALQEVLAAVAEEKMILFDADEVLCIRPLLTETDTPHHLHNAIVHGVLVRPRRDAVQHRP